MGSGDRIAYELMTLIRILREVPDAALRREFCLSMDDYRILANLERGFERTNADLARRLGVLPSRASLLVSKLVDKGLVESRGFEGRRKILGTTRAGSSVFRSCKGIITRCYEDLMSSLDENEKEAFDVGMLSTALAGEGSLAASQAPDRVFLYVRAYSLSELLFMESSRNANLSYRELNTLLLLSQAGPMAQADICRKIVLSKSTACELVQNLKARGLVTTGGGLSRRAIRVTEKGEVKARRASDEVLDAFFGRVRPVFDIEMSRFQRISAKIIDRAWARRMSMAELDD